MKFVRRIAVLSVSIGMVFSPFCPMVAEAQTMHMSEPQTAASMVHVDRTLPPCCALNAQKEHSGERFAVLSGVGSFTVPPAAIASFHLPERLHPARRHPPNGARHKFESRSQIKRE